MKRYLIIMEFSIIQTDNVTNIEFLQADEQIIKIIDLEKQRFYQYKSWHPINENWQSINNRQFIPSKGKNWIPEFMQGNLKYYDKDINDETLTKLI